MREKEKESHEEEKKREIAKQKTKLRRNGSLEGRSRSELESSLGFLGRVKNGVSCANVVNNRGRLCMVVELMREVRIGKRIRRAVYQFIL